MKLSLVLPIYNVEKYISKCLDSIYSQSLNEKDFEVIAIIDGSPDNSIDIVNEYSKLHSNLVVIDKENGGVSSARNRGIEVAKGDYIMFIDPDDILIQGSLKSVCTSIEEKCIDIAVLRSYSNNKDKEEFAWKHKIETKIISSGIEIYEKGYTRGGVWGVVYNRTFIIDNQLEFPLNIKNSEDAFFFMQCQIKAKRMTFLDIDTYLVITRQDSASQEMSKERISLWFNTLKLINKFKHDSSRNEIEIAMADGLAYSIISDITKNAIKTMGWEAKEFLLHHSINEYLPICQENIKRSSKSNYIMKRIINFSFSAFFFMSYIRYK